jgi:AcrR family transcriptional regulator
MTITSPKRQVATAHRGSPSATTTNERGPDRHAAEDKPRRADARRNYERLLAAADAEFTERGANASLEDIAKRAGVGIGTLYRHFPTRDDLIARVLEESTQAIVARGRALLDKRDPAAQLLRWLHDLVAFVTTYRDLTAAIANSIVAETGTRLCSGCEAITETGAALLARAQDAGQIRGDAEIKEVILSAHAAAWIAEQTKDPSAVDRLLGILFDGLRATASKPPKPKRRAKNART